MVYTGGIHINDLPCDITKVTVHLLCGTKNPPVSEGFKRFLDSPFYFKKHFN
jgi:hypothetical protein